MTEAVPPSRDQAPSSRLIRFWGYIAAVTVAGVALTVAAVVPLRPGDFGVMGPPFLVVATLLVLTELRPLITPGSSDVNGVTISTAFVFVLLLAFGIMPAVLMQVVATVLAEAFRRKAWWRTAFNAAQYVVSWWAAYGVLVLFGAGSSPAHPLALSAGQLVAVLAAATAYFVVNDLLVSQAIALREETHLRDVFFDEFGYQVAASGTLLVVAPLVVVVQQSSAWFIPLFLLPLLAVYATAAMSVDKEHQAHHDALTGLPNRKLLVSRVREALEEAQRGHRRLALFLLDLDRFKEVNDTLGHAVGDELLRRVSGRISDVLRPGDTVARLGGDEFAVLLPTLPDDDAAVEVAHRIAASLVRPIHYDGMSFDLEASMGIAFYPDHGTDFETLLQRADVAMYVAKETGADVELYRPERDRNSATRLGVLGELRSAIESGELELHYQPKARLADGAVTGVEALVRWNHPRRGQLSPEEFVPAAEQSAIMRVLTQHVIDGALRQASEWWRSGLPVQVAVNISVRDLHDVALADFLRRRLEAYDLPAAMLQLEITEHLLMADATRAASTLHALDALGVELSLDDFGTGYSSLVHLKRLPVHEIKIDRSFVQRMDVSEEDAAIVRAIVDLGLGLGLRVVAEGVETGAAWDRLSALGCHSAQGWFLARPMAVAAATAWLETRPAQSTGAMLSLVPAPTETLPPPAAKATG